MKKLLFTFMLCSLLLVSKAQDASVEKSIFGTQIGWLGFWFYNEVKLSTGIVLRSELGLTGTCEYYVDGYHDNSWFFLAPSLTLEPKWYFNIKGRNDRGKNISGNSANFISIRSTYIPEWFAVTNNDKLVIPAQIAIIPTLGIKRNIGKQFDYEIGGGIGYRYIFNNSTNKVNESEVALNLHIRIGYKF